MSMSSWWDDICLVDMGLPGADQCECSRCQQQEEWEDEPTGGKDVKECTCSSWDLYHYGCTCGAFETEEKLQDDD